MSDPKVTVHMVQSLDGYVVKPDGSVGWLETSDRYEAGVDDPDVEAFLASVGCYLIGSKTYERALELGWPYGDTPTVVLTRRELRAERESVQFRGGDLRALVRELLASFGDVWVCGGPALTKSLPGLDLVDELCVSVAPIVMGQGLPFFDRVGVERALHLKDAKAYRSGVVELLYEVRRG